MKTSGRVLRLLFMILVTYSVESLAAPRVIEIMQHIDRTESLQDDLTVKFRLTEQKLNQGVKVLEGIWYRRDWADSFLLVITAPEVNKGNAYLRNKGNMWIYRRNTRTFQIMHRMQSLEGTDVDAGDVERKKLMDLYEPALDEQGREILSEDTLGSAQIPVYRFTLRAKSTDAGYPTLEFWVRQDNFLRLMEKAYALSGTHMETRYFPKYIELPGGGFVFIKLIVIDEFEKGNKTIAEFLSISPETIDDAVFSKAYLESLSK